MKNEKKSPEFEAFEVDAKTKEQEKKRPRFTFHSFRMIYKGVKIPWGRYLLAAFLALVFYLIAGSNAGITAKIASGDFSDTGAIVRYAVVSILALGTAVAGVAMDFANFRLNTRIKGKLWKKILRLPMKYFDKESPNRIISRITVDSDKALLPFTMFAIFLVFFATIFGVILSSFGVFNTPMAKWLLVGIAIMVVLVIACMLAMTFVGFISANRLSAFTAFLSERLSNFKLIKASQSEENELKKAHQLIYNRMKADMYGLYANVVNYMSSSVLFLFGYLGGFFFGWRYFQEGLVTSGQTFIQFNAFAGGLAALVTFLGVLVTSLGAGAGGAAVFAKIFDEKEEDLEAGSEMPAESKDLILKDVSFSYDDSHKVLKGINCRIRQGEVTAIVGANGSGKSTLIKILDRLYTDAEGDVYFGEEKADTISLASWRNRIGIVSQNASLFSGSIRDNICYGIENVTEEELSTVCRMAGVDEILSAHEEGLDYEVGINGSKLSGGEQQRVSIARAMIKNPDYLILDEATANLDMRTGRAIQESIDSLMKGRTVITIAHNYETIRQSDQIIVLSEGEMLARGTHEELIKSCEFYQQLYAAGFEV